MLCYCPADRFVRGDLMDAVLFISWCRLLQFLNRAWITQSTVKVKYLLVQSVPANCWNTTNVCLQTTLNWSINWGELEITVEILLHKGKRDILHCWFVTVKLLSHWTKKKPTNTHKHLAFLFSGKGYSWHSFIMGICQLQLRSAVKETWHPLKILMSVCT